MKDDTAPPTAEGTSTTEGTTADASASSSSSAPKKEKKPAEPSSETLQNFSRVTPSQLAHIVFPTENRFQPVRAVASQSTTARSATAATSGSGKAAPVKKADRYAGGGGILVLVDTKPEEGEPEWVQSLAEAAAVATAAAAAPAAGTNAALQPSASAIVEDEPGVEPPASFEVSSILIRSF